MLDVNHKRVCVNFCPPACPDVHSLTVSSCCIYVWLYSPEQTCRFDFYRGTINGIACTSSWVNPHCLCSKWCSNCINSIFMTLCRPTSKGCDNSSLRCSGRSAIFMATLAFLRKVQWVYRQSVVCLPAWTVFSIIVSCCLWSGYRQGSKTHSSAIACSYCL